MTLHVGVNASDSELAATIAQFPGMWSCRVFGPPGSGILGWNSPEVTKLRKNGIVAHLSFKDWADDASAKKAVLALLDTFPSDVKQVILTYRHEPEGDMDSNEFRRRWVLLASWVRAHKNTNRVLLIPIHTLYPSRFKIGDRYSTDWKQWVGLWQQWAPFDSRNRYVGDAIGFDCYQTVRSLTYEDPEDFFRIPVSAAHALDVPLAIPEFGGICIPSDKTGTGRAEWITDCVDYVREIDAMLINWWNSKDEYDYRLTDASSRRAWLQEIVKR